mmetsp:Transcript_13313/g.27354  ORF Transcript_13313/g.27354 Transcript_13313/m.27354 type:complete len:551 (-) Transcript_13313:282-1934(-)
MIMTTTMTTTMAMAMAMRRPLFLFIVGLLLLPNAPVSIVAARRGFANNGNGSGNSKKQFASDNYYTVLGLAKNAKAKEIKSAYRKLALRYHPDKVKEGENKEEAEDIFVKVSHAYSVLSDKEKRKIYDRYGKNGLDAFERGQDPASAGFGGFSGGGGGNGNGSSGSGSGSHRGGFSGFGQQQHGGFGQSSGGGFSGFGGFGGGGRTQGGFDPFSMFEEMFAGQAGGGFGGGQHRRREGRQQQQQRQQQRQQQQPDLFPRGQSHVARLGKPKFPDQNSKHMWMIMFYSNANKESRQVSEKYENLASQSNLPYKVGAVDCKLSQREEKFCANKGIDSGSDLPSFGLVADGELIMYKDYNYQTASSSKAFHNFCMEHIPKKYVRNINNVPQINERLLSPKKEETKRRTWFQSSSSSTTTKTPKTPAVLLLTDKYQTSSVFYSLAYYFRKDFVFGESRAKNLKLSQTFKVKKYPTLVVFVPSSISASLNVGNGNSNAIANAKLERFDDNYDAIRYTGSLKKEKIIAWLAKLKTGIQKAEAKNSNAGRRTTKTEF